MADGTRAKQMENRLDAIEVGLRQHQEQVKERLETLELGMRHTQEEIHRSRSEYTDSLDRAVHGLREEFARLSQQLTAALSMFARNRMLAYQRIFPQGRPPHQS